MENLARILDIAPAQPAEHSVAEAAKVLSAGGVMAFPTDTLYGIGCAFDQRAAADRIHALRGTDGKKRPLTFILPDLGEVARWAKVSGTGYKIMSRIFPGPYCVELEATARVPNPYLHNERKTIGVRVPDAPFCMKVAWLLGQPILTATAKARDGQTLHTAQEIQREFGKQLDLIVDGGLQSGPPSTVVSLVDDWVQVLREGRGPSSRILVI